MSSRMSGISHDAPPPFICSETTICKTNMQNVHPRFTLKILRILKKIVNMHLKTGLSTASRPVMRFSRHDLIAKLCKISFVCKICNVCAVFYLACGVPLCALWRLCTYWVAAQQSSLSIQNGKYPVTTLTCYANDQSITMLCCICIRINDRMQ